MKFFFLFVSALTLSIGLFHFSGGFADVVLIFCSVIFFGLFLDDLKTQAK
jgi:hypothetical protein